MYKNFDFLTSTSYSVANESQSASIFLIAEALNLAVSGTLEKPHMLHMHDFRSFLMLMAYFYKMIIPAFLHGFDFFKFVLNSKNTGSK